MLLLIGGGSSVPGHTLSSKNSPGLTSECLLSIYIGDKLAYDHLSLGLKCIILHMTQRVFFCGGRGHGLMPTEFSKNPTIL